ncbi:MAG: cyclic nucleotide-binding domain-containing protein [Pseudomonadota bacterium]
MTHDTGHSGDAVKLPGPTGRTIEQVFFSGAFETHDVDVALLVPWKARAATLQAESLSSAEGVKLLQRLWARDRHMGLLDPAGVFLMERFFHFARVPAGLDVILQGEYGSFMLVLLDGTIAVDRLQPWGERLRLAETRPGDILGEMSLLDSGIRFSTCTTLNECQIGILTAEAMDAMITAEPETAASLVTLLARKLSLRLRMVSARLSEAR